MVTPAPVATVHLWGHRVGAVLWDAAREIGSFEFDPSFLATGYDLAPIMMPAGPGASGQVFSFPSISRDTFHGLPGLLADVLPDKFGTAIINAWLARQGRPADSFSPVERLCYTGTRGMGALEFQPATNHAALDRSVPIEISELVGLAKEIITQRSRLDAHLGTGEAQDAEAMRDILRVGTSAGGARAKAIIAMNGEGHLLSGQAPVPEGYDYWLLKFDGVSDLELGETEGYGRIEYAYHLMARAAGIEMSECRLLQENGRAHFLTKRFDRVDGAKIHMQSLCAIAHYDFNMPRAYGYEQAFLVMRQLRLTKAEAVQQFRRMVFNVVARNQDDHTKNVAFLMDQAGDWHLSPAFDVMYAHNPGGQWTNQHQMTINGKSDHFSREDIIAVGRAINLSRPQRIIDEVVDVVARWAEFAKQAGVPDAVAANIGRYHRLKLPSS